MSAPGCVLDATLVDGEGTVPDEVPRVTIITPTIEGREELLAEAAASVQAQTEECAHLIFLDTERIGPAHARNHLLALVQSEWVGFLDDDDVLDPTHVEALMALLANGGPHADLAWPRCRTLFAEGQPVVRIFQPIRGAGDIAGMLRGGRNWIPVTVLARTEAVRQAGGFHSADRYEDWSLWARMHALGHRFVHLPQATWTYRFLGDNRTHS